MKSCLAILVAVFAVFLGISPQNAAADNTFPTTFEIRYVSDFYESLSPFGNWEQIQPYGWCWQPAYVENDWRPYVTGNWLWTDDGWYWMSDEPWAWATYHYGRWMWNSNYGWFWVPGVEWAPAWVSWREGDDYVGWAPLPPGCDFRPQQTVIYAEEIVYAPNTFVFVERRHFCEPIRPSVLVVNQTIVNKTVNVTKIQKVNQVVINQGPRMEEIQRVTKREVPFAEIQNLRSRVSYSGKREIPAPRERPDRVKENNENRTRPQIVKHDFEHETLAPRGGGVVSSDKKSVVTRRRDSSEVVQSFNQSPPSIAPNQQRNHDAGDQRHNQGNQQRQVAVNSVPAPSSALTRVAKLDQDVNRAGSGVGFNNRRERGIHDDAPNGNHH